MYVPNNAEPVTKEVGSPKADKTAAPGSPDPFKPVEIKVPNLERGQKYRCTIEYQDAKTVEVMFTTKVETFKETRTRFEALAAQCISKESRHWTSDGKSIKIWINDGRKHLIGDEKWKIKLKETPAGGKPHRFIDSADPRLLLDGVEQLKEVRSFDAKSSNANSSWKFEKVSTGALEWQVQLPQNWPIVDTGELEASFTIVGSAAGRQLPQNNAETIYYDDEGIPRPDPVEAVEVDVEEEVGMGLGEEKKEVVIPDVEDTKNDEDVKESEDDEDVEDDEDDVKSENSRDDESGTDDGHRDESSDDDEDDDDDDDGEDDDDGNDGEDDDDGEDTTMLKPDGEFVPPDDGIASKPGQRNLRSRKLQKRPRSMSPAPSEEDILPKPNPKPNPKRRKKKQKKPPPKVVVPANTVPSTPDRRMRMLPGGEREITDLRDPRVLHQPSIVDTGEKDQSELTAKSPDTIKDEKTKELYISLVREIKTDKAQPMAEKSAGDGMIDQDDILDKFSPSRADDAECIERLRWLVEKTYLDSVHVDGRGIVYGLFGTDFSQEVKQKDEGAAPGGSGV